VISALQTDITLNLCLLFPVAGYIERLRLRTTNTFHFNYVCVVRWTPTDVVVVICSRWRRRGRRTHRVRNSADVSRVVRSDNLCQENCCRL